MIALSLFPKFLKALEKIGKLRLIFKTHVFPPFLTSEGSKYQIEILKYLSISPASFCQRRIEIFDIFFGIYLFMKINSRNLKAGGNF